MKLSPDQEIIVSMPGNLIVKASAGTGKTHTMVAKIAAEIKNNHTHKVISAVTFTIKAAQEIRDRLTVDVSQHFIGTNNSFAIEEIIKPFMKDVYGTDFDLDMSTDYSTKITTFHDGVEKIRKNQLLCSYTDNKKNFIFELAQNILEQSTACKLYLQAKYFKIYIDEYQDCDKSMHNLFMYICDELHIETFVIGDEKQSVYIWRGAYPKAFNSIWTKSNFTKKVLRDNFRSCQQIQNYSNLLCEETCSLYEPTESLKSILWIKSRSDTWASEVLKYINPAEKSALLRFSNASAEQCAKLITELGLECIFIPQTPITDITTDTAWLYFSVAKYFIIEEYSVYNFILEIPLGNNKSTKNLSFIMQYFEKIRVAVESKNKETFFEVLNNLAQYIGYTTKSNHVESLYNTIIDSKYHVSFEPEKHKHVAITFHSSKGLEFEQVVVFAEDYRLSTIESIYNHYVAVTRAKSKLIIVDLGDYNANCFRVNIEGMLKKRGLQIDDIISVLEI